jgi:hypothetical protein
MVANRRDDDLFHAYNLITIEKNGSVSVAYLSEMLEGQVAALSSGKLSAKEALSVLNALKRSKLYRVDQGSYLLYPARELPGFMAKNNIAKNSVNRSKLLNKLVEDGNSSLIEKDSKGTYHFNGKFRNAKDLKNALNHLDKDTYGELVEKEEEMVLEIFEEVFNHKAFTGRSGTFYGYEGLGSIYWHMVSKLLLAVQECCVKAFNEKENSTTIQQLLNHYFEINEGIGVNKPPRLYGAFPTDPYSHTPAGRGAQQPGMTGQVKEDILCRFGELGVFVQNGKIVFAPFMLYKEEFLSKNEGFVYTDLNGLENSIELKPGNLAFTYCQLPVVYELSTKNGIEVYAKDGSKTMINNLQLNEEISQGIFLRNGDVSKLLVHIDEKMLN